MKIEVATEAPGDWDEYVGGHAFGSAYHTASAVRLSNTVFGLRTYFVSARGANRELAGVVPLIEQSSIVFGRNLTSLPFVTYGGILSNSTEVTKMLVRAVDDLVRSRRAQHAELRHLAPVPGATLPQRVDKVSMFRELPQDEETLAKELGSKLRSQIRRAEREDPVVEWGGFELVPEFYAVFAPSMHALGTPVLPRRFFEMMLQSMAGEAAIVVVRVRDKVEASAMTVRHGNRIEVPWASATVWGKRNAINMRMYWELLRFAIAKGAMTFDFGRSSVGSGTYRFKEQWGAKPTQLHWNYLLGRRVELPMLNHQNPKYALAVRLWQKMPLWLANRLGPHVVRNLP